MILRFLGYIFLSCFLYTSAANATDCRLYWNSSLSVPTGFASAYDVYNTSQPLISVNCNSPPNVSLTVGTQGSTTQFIYSIAYLSTDGSIWTPITLTSTNPISDTGYFQTTATGTLTLTALELDNWSYIAFLVAYKQTDGTWRYGCRDATCASAVGWNLQAITTNTITPTPVEISLSPSTVTLTDNTSAGVVVSTATVAMSDGSTFAGTLSITGSGTSFLHLVGNNIVLQRGLTSVDDGTFSVTIAVQ